MHYPHLAARIFNTPLLVHPAKLDAMIAGIGPRLLGLDSLPDALAHTLAKPSGDALAAQAAGRPVPQAFSTAYAARHDDAGFSVTADGVALVCITGALVHRSRLDADCTYLQGYDSIAWSIEAALAAQDVRALVLRVDSPGGEVAGAFELAERIAALRGSKPIVAVADSLAASAAYLIASAADEVVLTSTAYVGSVGVVARHVDMSAALQADGIKVTHIFAGAHKVDGNPYEPLPESVRADFQADIDGLYHQFIETVATHRRMDAQAVRATQAQTYRGVAAIAAGLADRIGTLDQVLRELGQARTGTPPAAAQVSQVSQPGRIAHHQEGALSMPQVQTASGAAESAQAPAAATATPAITQADVQAAAAQAAADERARVTAIFALPAAAAHPGIAQQCVACGLTPEQASAMLGAAPAPAAAAQTGGSFATVMSAMGNPDVSGVEAAAEGQLDAAATAAQILNAFSAARA